MFLHFAAEPMRQLGRYEILAELGRGAMGAVYRARDPKIDRVVAIKTIIPVLANPEQERDFRNRFFREAQAAGKLSHPGIVTIFDAGEDEPTRTPFIVMEYISGRTLEDWLSAPGQRPALETGLNWVKQVAEALDYAHRRGIVHRDVKPANIIITPDGRAKITDFGVAKVTESEFTAAGQILGTPAYMSPEQLSGHAVDGRSDIFSLGAILYWVLTAEKPFTGDTAAVLLQVVSQDPAPVSARNSALTPDFDRVVQRALAKDPAVRYQRGEDLAADLGDLLKKQPPRIAKPKLAAKGTLLPPAADRTGKTPADQPIRRESENPVTGVAAAAGRAQPVSRSVREPRAGGLSRITPKTRVAIAAGAMALLLVALRFGAASRPVAVQAPPPTAELQVRAHHSFISASLSVWADDKLVYEGRLAGVIRMRGSSRTSVEGNFAETVSVPAGNRLLKVRVTAPRTGYDEVAEIKADLQPHSSSTLIISFGRTGGLRLGWQP